jgi:hypothetical protein
VFASRLASRPPTTPKIIHKPELNEQSCCKIRETISLARRRRSSSVSRRQESVKMFELKTLVLINNKATSFRRPDYIRVFVSHKYLFFSNAFHNSIAWIWKIIRAKKNRPTFETTHASVILEERPLQRNRDIHSRNTTSIVRIVFKERAISPGWCE